MKSSLPEDFPADRQSLLSIPAFVMLALHYWRRLLLVVLVATGVSYVLIRLLIAPKYQAYSLVIPHDEQSRNPAASLLKGMGSIPLSSIGLSSSSEQLDLFITILASESTLLGLSEEYGLQRKYKTKRREDLLEALREAVGVGGTDEGALVVSCIHTSPDTAAMMANWLVDHLDSRVIELKVKKAASNREFLGSRLSDIRSQLAAAEDSLTAFQEENNLVEPGEQFRASLESYAKIEATLHAKEIERSILQRYLSPKSPQMAMLQAELSETKRKLQQMKRSSQRTQNVLHPMTEMPQKYKEYMRFEKSIRILLELETLVLPMYEQAKYEEQKSIPVIQVIDNATPPEKKFFPPRILMAGSIGIIAGLIYFVTLFMRVFIPTVKSPAWVALFRRLGMAKS